VLSCCTKPILSIHRRNIIERSDNAACLSTRADRAALVVGIRHVLLSAGASLRKERADVGDSRYPRPVDDFSMLLSLTDRASASTVDNMSQEREGSEQSNIPSQAAAARIDRASSAATQQMLLQQHGAIGTSSSFSGNSLYLELTQQLHPQQHSPLKAAMAAAAAAAPSPVPPEASSRSIPEDVNYLDFFNKNAKTLRFPEKVIA